MEKVERQRSTGRIIFRASYMSETLVLTTLSDDNVLDGLREQGYCVVLLSVDEALQNSLDALDEGLRFYPPTSLNEAKDTWLPEAAEFAGRLAVQAVGSGEVLNWDVVPERFSHVFVVSERILPVDLIPCRGSVLGTECIIAHRAPESKLHPTSVLGSEELPLRRIAHVSTYHPGSTSLHEMDVVSATLSIDNNLAIEHYFYPTKEVAMGLFRRSDLDILHFECHGTGTSLQVDNPYGDPVDVRELCASNGPSVYFFLGCSAGESIDSVASTFVKKGARGALGAYCGFLSGGGSGEVSISAYYDALYQGLIGGETLGASVKAGRRAASPGRIYYCTWLLFGNPNVHFSTQRFGGTAPNPRFHRTAGFATHR